MKKPVCVCKENEQKINEIIKSVEGKAWARTVDYKMVERYCKRIEIHFASVGLPKSNLNGSSFTVEAYINKYPSSYDWPLPMATSFEIAVHHGKWYLTDVWRYHVRNAESNPVKCYISDEALKRMQSRLHSGIAV